jgi:hypothetical protein
MGKRQEAMSTFDSALRLDPNYAPALDARSKLNP